jgi:hypothetical protein
MAEKFRISKPTLAVLAATRLAVVVPAGEVIEIPSDAPAGNRMVDVVWNGAAAMMFVQDLRERTENVSNRAASGGL